MLYAYVAAALLAGAAGAAAGWQARAWKSDADAAEVRERAAETQQLRERAIRESVARVDSATENRLKAAQTARVADRSELERLLAAAAQGNARDSTPSCEPVEQRFAECKQALTEGARLVAEGADLVRVLESKNQGLREYAAQISGVQLEP